MSHRPMLSPPSYETCTSIVLSSRRTQATVRILFFNSATPQEISLQPRIVFQDFSAKTAQFNMAYTVSVIVNAAVLNWGIVVRLYALQTYWKTAVQKNLTFALQRRPISTETIFCTPSDMVHGLNCPSYIYLALHHSAVDKQNATRPTTEGNPHTAPSVRLETACPGII